MDSSGGWYRRVFLAAGVEMVLLIVQYLLGMWTNVYAPSTPAFYAMKNYLPLGLHVFNGDALFLLGLVALIFSILSRRMRLIVPAVVLSIAVLAAGEFGMAFENSINPIYSFGMGTMWLVAFFAASALLMVSRRPQNASMAPPTVTVAGSPSG